MSTLQFVVSLLALAVLVGVATYVINYQLQTAILLLRSNRDSLDIIRADVAYLVGERLPPPTTHEGYIPGPPHGVAKGHEKDHTPPGQAKKMTGEKNPAQARGRKPPKRPKKRGKK